MNTQSANLSQAISALPKNSAKTLDLLQRLIVILSDYINEAKQHTKVLESAKPPIKESDIIGIEMLDSTSLLPEETKLLVFTRNKGPIPATPINSWTLLQLMTFLKWIVNKEIALKNKLLS